MEEQKNKNRFNPGAVEAAEAIAGSDDLKLVGVKILFEKDPEFQKWYMAKYID